MHSLLNARPDGFDSPEEAIEWQYVRLYAPPQPLTLSLLITSVTTNAIRNPISARVSVPSIIVPSTSPSSAAPAYEWRTTLRSTAPYWASTCTFFLSFISPSSNPVHLRLVHIAIQFVSLRAHGAVTCPGWYRPTRQRTYDRTDAGEVPDGGRTRSRSYVARGARFN